MIDYLFFTVSIIIFTGGPPILQLIQSNVYVEPNRSFLCVHVMGP